jgi:hypothetical protein
MKALYQGAAFSRAEKRHKKTRALQAPEKLSKDSKKCQGTTLVVPQVLQN